MPRQAELQRTRASPPAKADTLDVAAHEGGEPYGGVPVSVLVGVVVGVVVEVVVHARTVRRPALRATRGDDGGVTEPLAQYACQDACQWQPDAAAAARPRRFACTGCGSQWDRSQLWTPIDRDGTVPASVREEIERAAGT